MKILLNILTAIIVAYTIWLAISWIDIVADNNTTNPEHSDFNLIIMLSEAFE